MAEFCHFRCNDHPAVTLERIVLEVFLMVIFCNIETVKRSYFGNDGIIPKTGSTDLPDDFLGNFFLLCIVVENRRTVLRTGIVALAVKRSGVVDGEKYGQQIF